MKRSRPEDAVPAKLPVQVATATDAIGEGAAEGSTVTSLESMPIDLQGRIRSLEAALPRWADATPHTRASRQWRTSRCTEKTSFDMASATKTYAPLTMGKQFQDLHRLLHPALVGGLSNVVTADESKGQPPEISVKKEERRSNVSAFIQGPRGSGKTLLLNRVLCAMEDELQCRSTQCQLFRIVYINGLVVPGHSVSTIVREILSQLSDAASAEAVARQRASVTKDAPCDSEQPDHLGPLLQLKQTSFTNQLQLLSEIIQLASVDGIPILFVFDELEAFLGTGSSSSGHSGCQLLLYHLLDRIASSSPGSSLCSLVGLTCDSSILTRLDKRIKSRAEGTAKFILTGRCPTLALVGQVLCSRLGEPSHDPHNVPLRDELSSYFDATLASATVRQERVHDAMRRDFRTGKDIRWFSRLFYLALARYRGDLCDKQALMPLDTTCPLFHPKYLEEALRDMGGSVLVDDTAHTTHAESSSQQPDADHFIQALRDLSGPSVALVLAARRILERDHRRTSAQSEASSVQHPQLSLSRLLHEYQSTYKGPTAQYSGRVLRQAFVELTETGVMRPAADHTGGGPWEYQHRLGQDTEHMEAWERMPLQLTVDIYRVLKPAIDDNVLSCSSALREWGRKLY